MSLDRRSASVGRGRSMDWVLPDPAKHISSHHFNITFSDGSYWITDVSTNGTFLQGQRHRLEGPYCLRNGERLLVGHYIIGVQIVTAAPPLATDAVQPHQPAWGAPPAVADDSDPWEFGGAATPPVHPVPPPPSVAPMQGIGSDFIPLQQPNHHQGGRQSPGIQAPGLQHPSASHAGTAYPTQDNPALQQPGSSQNAPPVTMPPFGSHAPPPALQMPGVADQLALRPAPVPPAP